MTIPLSFSREELAWAAGLFDGEGHIRSDRRFGNGQLTRHLERRVLRITINQADRQVLDRFRNAVGGLGRIYGPRSYRSGTQAWYFLASSFEDTQAIAAMLWGWLSPIKKEQVRRALQAMRDYYSNPALRLPHPHGIRPDNGRV